MPDIVDRLGEGEIVYSRWVDSRWADMQGDNKGKFSETCSQIRTFSVGSKVVHSSPFKAKIIVSLTNGPYLNRLTRRLGLKVGC
jgi:hypothetical protein